MKRFTDIYRTYYRKSFLFAKSYVHDDLVAEDIASEALIKLWETMKQEEVLKPLPLLLTILKHKSLDYMRSCRIRNEAISSIEDWQQRELAIRISTLQACDPDEIFSDEISRIVQNTLTDLPEQTRRVFQMSRFEHLSVKEIAEKMNLSVKGVDYHISKALKKLRISLRDYLPLLLYLARIVIFYP